MNELDELLKAFGEAGGDRSILIRRDIAHLAASGHKVLSSRAIEGLDIQARETFTGIHADVRVLKGVKIGNPIHLCFGVLKHRGTQKIRMNIVLERNSRAHFIAHCIFPRAEKVKHIMDAEVELQDGAEMHYTEAHFHGYYGGVEVVPKANIRVHERGRYSSEFVLTTGRVGFLDIDYTVSAGDDAIVEMIAKVFGHANDEIKVKEAVRLDGKDSKGLVKIRIALEDEAVADVEGITEGNAPGARGHVDCLEIVKDNAMASAIPVVRVSDPQAKVTHEAAIGSIDKKQLETLMARGLSPEQAVDVIVKGILR